MASREEAPKVNAGSMADIAFLLLIFFLVTTTIETDAGLDRMLTRPNIDVPPPIPERNILPILINGQDELMVDKTIIDLKDLKDITISFLDNGGASNESENYCIYCQGERNAKSSDNPDKAIVSLMSNRETTYGVYIAVQNELVAAYNHLRNREAQRLYKTDFTAMEVLYANAETPKVQKDELKKKIRSIQKLYPMKLSEAERQ
ncbi:biopolymer transporter ExbD [Maribacter algarum]|uniref:Biopolymer transporter ExbD n=1 Tax=Maribacter algarum (ex Zhang et al. 2020) TaxID=2578118 RepID=A0A5S3PVU5_9FLAO|nr:biopolymer transporter ExbD [Maribacter algarum]TMM58332.1 biopolymer transporter ExbD [Maribacter algarum]